MVYFKPWGFGNVQGDKSYSLKESQNMTQTREQKEKLLVSEIKMIMQIPNKDVHVMNWVEKFVVPATKITVSAGRHYFILDEIPGNSYSMDIVVDGRKMWVTSEACAQELFTLRQLLIDQYGEKTK